MFGIGFLEIAVIAVVAIVFVGPKRLPEMMKHLGKFFVQAKRVSNDVKSTFDDVVRQAEQEVHLDNLKKIKELTGLTDDDLQPKENDTHEDDVDHDYHDEHGHDDEEHDDSQPQGSSQEPQSDQKGFDQVETKTTDEKTENKTTS